jgi:hypothetical protein
VKTPEPMMHSTRKDARTTDIADRLRATAEDLVELVTAQVKLGRLELLADARALGRRLTRLLIFLPLLVLGYGFLAGAAAWALAQLVGLGWSLAIIGAVHAAAGGWGMARALEAFREVKVLDRSRDELERSIERVAAAPAARPLPPSSP